MLLQNNWEMYLQVNKLLIEMYLLVRKFQIECQYKFWEGKTAAEQLGDVFAGKQITDKVTNTNFWKGKLLQSNWEMYLQANKLQIVLLWCTGHRIYFLVL